MDQGDAYVVRTRDGSPLETGRPPEHLPLVGDRALVPGDLLDDPRAKGFEVRAPPVMSNP